MKQQPLLDVLENLSLLGSGVGTVASVVLNQSTYAIAPLSVAIALGAINRQRYQQAKEDEQGSTLAELDQRLSQKVDALSQQVTTMPSPETIDRLKKGIVFKNRELAEHLYAEITSIQEDLQTRLVPLEQEGLVSLRHDVQQLNDKYTNLSKGFTQLQANLSQVSNINPTEQVEALIRRLQTEVVTLQTSLETLTQQTRPNLNSLQEQVTRLDRQFSKLPPPVDIGSLKQEVGELVKLIADLIHKRDFTALVQEVQALQQQQGTMKRSLESIETAAVNFKRTLNQLPKVQEQTATSDSTSDDAISDLNGLLSMLSLEPGAIPTGMAADVYSELQTLASNYLQQAQTRLAELQTLTTDLVQQQNQLRDQAKHLPKNLDVVAIQRQLHDLSKRIPATENALKGFKSKVQRVIQQELQYVNERLKSLPNTPSYELIFDLGSVQNNPTQPSQPVGSQAILIEALEHTQNRLILIWPWSSQCQLDAALMQKLEAFLQKGRQLHIGWCQMAERDEDKLLSKIRRGWMSEGDRQNELQTTLHKLLQLKRKYPDQFQFKILGTSENFLISDDAFAVLGIADALKTFTTFPELQLKLRTRNPDVIQQLIQRFDDPTLITDDVTAYWNRAVTRHNLGDKAGAIADYTHILTLHADDAIAYNHRGLAHYESGDLEAAISNFTQSIRFNPHQAAAYCNRGFVRYEQGDFGGAINDYSHAIQMRSHRAIAYFYRGMVWQKLKNDQEALSDYTEAAYLAPDSAVAHYYRGLTWQKLNNYPAAITDLEIAAKLFIVRKSQTNAQKALKHIAKLKQQLAAEPQKAHLGAATQSKNGTGAAHPDAAYTEAPHETIVSFFQLAENHASPDSDASATTGTLPLESTETQSNASESDTLSDLQDWF